MTLIIFYLIVGAVVFTVDNWNYPWDRRTLKTELFFEVCVYLFLWPVMLLSMLIEWLERR